MIKKKGKRGKFSDNPRVQNSSESNFLLKLMQDMSQRLKDECGYTNDQIFEALTQKTEAGILIPISIFAKNLCPSEALTKYLKEEHNLNYHDISILINRNERGVWANYQRAIKKQPSRFKIIQTISIPVFIFQNNKLSILECLVSYLKDVKQIKNAKIAELLGKKSSNIWVVYERAKQKEVKNE